MYAIRQWIKPLLIMAALAAVGYVVWGYTNGSMTGIDPQRTCWIGRWTPDSQQRLPIVNFGRQSKHWTQIIGNVRIEYGAHNDLLLPMTNLEFASKQVTFELYNPRDHSRVQCCLIQDGVDPNVADFYMADVSDRPHHERKGYTEDMYHRLELTPRVDDNGRGKRVATLMRDSTR